MSKHYMVLAAIGALVACTAAARPSLTGPGANSAPEMQAPSPEGVVRPTAQADARVAPAPTSDQASCDIRATPTRHGVQIEGIVHARHAISGEYQLAIAKGGGAGTSDISQGGPFTAGAGQSITLGSSEISVERSGHYRATLILRDAQGVEICRRSISA